jgi:tetratricopeptide (TPR) repeat protein
MAATESVGSHDLQGGSAMSRTLNLADCLLAMGRNFQELGRWHDALGVLGRLAGFRELPGPVAEEAQVRLAEIRLNRRQFARARRHLTAALAHRPDSALYHYLMAGALLADSKCDQHRAADHYRKSLQLDPTQVPCLTELGLLLVRLGQTDEGVRYLRRAAELSPNCPEAVGQLAAGLGEAGQAEEARGVLLAARFRNPRDSRFLRLWTDFQFQRLREEQERARRNEALQAQEAGPTLLPFVRPDPGSTPSRMGRKSIRRDGSSALPEPHGRHPAWLPDRRHA